MITNKTVESYHTNNLWRKVTIGMCLALLAHSPLKLLGQGVINSNSIVGVNLNTAFSPAIHTVTVNSGVTVNNSSNGNNAISGDTRPWHLINNGSLNGNSDGVNFAQGGSVNNTASVYGGDNGISIYGNAGAVINSGSITGYYYDGIYFGSGGSVNNLSGGTITGNGYNNDGGAGVQIYGGFGLVNNAGTIQSGESSGLDAIYMNQGGSVTNSGYIYGDNNGVNIYGGTGSVVNSGYIAGYNSDGVYMNQGGSVSNTGSIYGNNNGVNIYGGTGSVINHGEATIQGYNSDGVYIDQAGSVDNSGGIYGYNNGVYINGAGSVVNNGGIYGGYNGGYSSVSPNLSGLVNQDYAGVYLNAGGVVVNNGGIYGGYDIGSSSGVYITGGAGYVTNSGEIYGNGADGVDLQAGGVVNNTTNGSIGGSVNGVLINGPATVINDGGIYGNGGAGVYLTQGGSVANSGVIYGYYNGVEVYNGTGSVVNSGNITGGSGDGVYMDLGGTVTNNRYGNISGAQNGVSIFGNVGTVYNNGAITGTNNDGVLLGAGGTVYNDYYATISGGQNGVVITNGSGYVENYGSITGQNGDGVQLHGGGTVYNGSYYNDYSSVNSHSQSFSPSYYYGYAMIAGAQNGVNITGETGYVYNYYGSITGANNDGVHLGAGGEVYNYDYYGAISGGQNGVSITGGNGYVYNYGTIIGTNNDGVSLGAGGSVYNDNYGSISGGQNGVAITNNALILSLATPNIAIAPSYTVYNNGAISGTNNNGVYLNLGADSSVYNDYSGSISGGQNGVNITSGGGYVENYGTITGINNNGVNLDGNGSVYNYYHGIISGGSNGVVITGNNGYVENYGAITGTNNNGVYFTYGTGGAASLYNGNYGTINGGAYGVYMGGDGSVVNNGTITGGSYDGVYIEDYFYGNVTNTGHISGGRHGVFINYPGSVNNSGTIIGTSGNGVYIDGDGSVSGTVVNQYGGWIEGGQNGVRLTGGDATLINAGTIIGHNGTSVLLGNYNNSVTLQTGSHLVGDVYGGTANDALILQGTGSDVNNFYNFETLTVQADAWDGHTNGWNLTGNNTFTTNTTVESGLLRINGSLTTPLVEVETNGVLGGSGVIYGIVDNHGIFAPGNSPGTLTIIGSLTNGADYHAQVNADWSHDLIAVSDTATITGGDVVVQLEHKVYGSSNTVAILTATNGVTGTYGASYFDTNSAVPIFLTQVLTYDTNNVYLTLGRKKFGSVANTYNQKGVAGALDGIVDSFSPGMSNLVTEFFWLGSASQARAALDSMSGEIHGTLGMLDVELENAFNQSVLKRTARMNAGQENGGYATRSQPALLASAGSTLPPMPADKSRPFDIWLQGFGTFGQLGGDGNALGGNYTISGMNGGFDYRLSPELMLGLAVGYSHNNADVGGPGASGNVDAIQIAAYGGYVSGPWRLDGIFSYGFLQTSTKRQINVGPIQQQAEGSYDGGVFSVSAEGGYAFEFGQVTLEPTLGVNYAHLSQNGFNETGSAAYDGNNYGLSVRDVGMDSFRSAAGVRLAAKLGKKDGVKFIPELRVAWEHEFADNTADVTARFVGGSGDFHVRGVQLGSDSGVAAAGLTVVFNKAIQASVDYDARMNERLTSHAISGRVSYSW